MGTKEESIIINPEVVNWSMFSVLILAMDLSKSKAEK